MMFSKRVHSSVPYPVHSELAPSSLSSPDLLAFPPATPPRGHKRSFSKPMTWLNRSSSSTSSRSVPQPAQAHPAPKPTRISEPKAGSFRSLEQFNSYRSGTLGSGATVVRTPREALVALSGSPHASELIGDQGVKSDILLHNTEKPESRHPPQPPSPPLPPLPDLSDVDGGSRLSGSSTNVSLSDHVEHPCTSDSPTPIPHPPSPPSHFCASSRSVPNLVADAAPISQQPPFQAILLSPVPDGAIDPSKLIVILETCATTYRTSLRSLTSRPSYLSRYITSLLSPVSEVASVYSVVSDASSAQRSDWFNSVFRDHLASAGCLPQSSSAIHIFLDRPSAPYTHVLAYLRLLPSTPDQPETLPRAVQLGARPSLSRHESLLELRDEARYLGLVELEKLCVLEMHRFHHRSALLPTASGSTLGNGKRTTSSVRSFRTVVERCQSRQEVLPAELQVLPKGDRGAGVPSQPVTRALRSSSSSEIKDALDRGRGKQWSSIKHDIGSPPPGWI